MLLALTRKWWLLLANGACAIGCGILALVWPVATLLALVMFCGVYCLIDGATSIGVALSTRYGRSRMSRQLLIGGILSLAAALLMLGWPDLGAIALLVIVASWAITRGLCEIVAAIHLRNYIHHELLLMIIGVLSIAFGIALVVRPAIGALAVIWLLGTFAIIRGGLLCALAFKLRGMKRPFSSTRHPPSFTPHIGR